MLQPIPASALKATDRPAALALDRVSHRYGQRLAVDDVSLTVAAGEIVCLVGPSGCGKSTLLRVAAGLEPLQQGRVSIDGNATAGPGFDTPPERRGVGLVFQDYALFPHLTVADNVRFGLHRLPGPEQKQRTLAALEQVGMAEYWSAYPHVLSGGQQQRVALARALAPRPSVLLLDEPFSGLDTRLREQVRDQTLHVLKESGAATLLVTHDPEEAMFLADRIALLRDGRLVQLGSPAELYLRPGTSYAAGFFGEVNRLSATVEDGRAQTALGAIPAPGLADGAPVDLLIRPEHLHLTQAAQIGFGGAGIGAEVLAARLLGRVSLVHLKVPAGDAGEEAGSVHLHARVPGVFLPPEKSHVSVTFDPNQAFVFPAGEAI